MTDTPLTLRPRSAMVHAGTRRSGFDETSEAIFANSGFVYTTAEEAEAAFQTDGLRFVYSRFRNPTVAMFEDRLAQYEGAPRCFATTTGMAAVFAALVCHVKAGDRVVAPYALFGSCLHIVKNILPQYGVTTVLVDGTDLAQWRAALSEPTAAVFLESPSNPTLDLVDIAAVAALGHEAGAVVMVDNVFATPMLQKPFTLGADVVIYSATKHIDGQGRALGGAILCRDDFAEKLGPFLRHTGPTMSPFNAWILLKGLETLELRVPAHVASAQRIAEHLEGRPGIAKVIYPGLPSHPQHALAKRQMGAGGPLVAFEMAGGKAAAFALMNALRLVKISNNLGDAKSLLCHPATTTHARVTEEDRLRVGIRPGSLRLSVGLEDPEDLIEDLERGLRAAAG
jgi:O-succinylhomoserine sulfhydrylase